DIAVAISDRSTDALNAMFNTEAGRTYLVDNVGCEPALVESLVDLGFSSICNTLAAIKTAKHLRLTSDDVIMTVATDGSEMYNSERELYIAEHNGGRYTTTDAAAAFAGHIEAVDTAHLLEMGQVERDRVFNLAYFTWVEQQGIEVPEFEARRRQTFWDNLRPLVGDLDELIVDFNTRTGLG
ncbi:MAG: pyridoxal-5'-phosphate-dependent protein subunit beta, partial [Actinomycetia bacterium]|nr:pyridoxal-5'-phosphate-dependent protein subunit beta [Actinomycetes bacterium]